MNVKIKWKKLAVSLAAPLAVGGLSALITKDNMLMFEVIEKPPACAAGVAVPGRVDDTLYPHGTCVIQSVDIRRPKGSEANGRRLLRPVARFQFRLADNIFQCGKISGGVYLAVPDVDIHASGDCPVLEDGQCGRMADAAVSPVDDFRRISEHGNLLA